MTARDDSDGLARAVLADQWRYPTTAAEIALARAVVEWAEAVTAAKDAKAACLRGRIFDIEDADYAARLNRRADADRRQRVAEARLLLLAGGAEVHTDKPKEPAP